MMKSSTAAKKLSKMFPEIKGICPGEEAGYSKGSIFLGDCAEGGTIDGVSACVYDSGWKDPKEKIWIMGVHKKLYAALDKFGYFAECHDPGTYVAYEA